MEQALALISNIPWAKLSEAGIITVVSVIASCLILRNYIDHKNNKLAKNAEIKQAELKVYFEIEQSKLKNELQAIRQEAAQITNTQIDASKVDVNRNTQLKSSTIKNGSKLTVRD